MSALELYDESDVKVDLNLAEGEKTRVLLFFATWCPHCQEELPRIIEFYTKLQASAYQDNVELVVVRTAISRESFSFPDFKKIFSIPFSVLTDKGLEFESFAKEQKMRVSYPKLTVVNQQGEVVYHIPPSKYGDTSKELFWLLDTLH